MWLCHAGLVWRVAGESDSEDDMSLSSEEASDDEVPENKAQVRHFPRRFWRIGRYAAAGGLPDSMYGPGPI